MNKVMILFVCFLVIMAILVGAGMIQERGFFLTSREAIEFMSPVMDVAEASFRLFLYGNTNYERNDLVTVSRIRFTVEGVQYYLDYARVSLGEKLSWNDFSKRGFIASHNYPEPLFVSRFNNFRVVLEDQSGNVVFQKRYFYIASADFIEYIICDYGFYLDNIKGVSGSIRDIYESLK